LFEDGSKTVQINSYENTTVVASDSHSGYSTIKYGWSQASNSTSATLSMNSGDKISSTCGYSGATGGCWLYVYVCDKVGNCAGYRTKAFNIDRKSPSVWTTGVSGDACVSKYCAPGYTKCLEINASDDITYYSDLDLQYSLCYSGSTSAAASCNYQSGGYSAYDRLNYYINNNAFKAGDNKTFTQYWMISSPHGMCTSYSIGYTINYAIRACDKAGNCSNVITASV